MSGSSAYPPITTLARRAVLLAVTVFFVLITSSSSRSQRRQDATPVVTYPPQLSADLRKLQEAALASDYAYRQLAHLTDSIGPRLSGSPQAEGAGRVCREGNATAWSGSETRKTFGAALGARRRNRRAGKLSRTSSRDRAEDHSDRTRRQRRDATRRTQRRSGRR